MKYIIPVLIGFVLGSYVMLGLKIRDLRLETERQQKVDAEIRSAVESLKCDSTNDDLELLRRRIVKIERILSARYEERKVSDTICIPCPVNALDDKEVR